MIYRRTVGFKREFRNLPPEIKRAARAKFALFSANWRHPSLHCHKLTGVFWHGHQVFDLYVTEKYRVLFAFWEALARALPDCEDRKRRLAAKAKDYLVFGLSA